MRTGLGWGPSNEANALALALDKAGHELRAVKQGGSPEDECGENWLFWLSPDHSLPALWHALFEGERRKQGACMFTSFWRRGDVGHIGEPSLQVIGLLVILSG